MKLMELFYPVKDNDQKFDSDVDYLDDLKFWISNNDEMLSKIFFPAVKKHKQQFDDEDVYKVYVEPLKKCSEAYCEEYDLLHSKDEIFTDEALLELAHTVAKEQAEFIKKGDYHHETE